MEKSDIIEIVNNNNKIELKTLIDYIENIKNYYDTDDSQLYIDVFTVINKCFKSRLFKHILCIGDADDFHNLSVVLARCELHDLSCIVLEYGIGLYPKSITLLADYIEYGIRCNEIKKCDKAYVKLTTIPKKRWNWRAYDFSIDYLVFKYENYSIGTESEIIKLINSYIEAFPEDERAYLSKANFYNSINNKKEEKKCLLDAINTVNVAPMCYLKMAELYFNEAKYDKAKELLNSKNTFSLHAMSSKEIGKIYLLSSLCGMAIYYLSPNEYLNITKDIYNDYKAAEKTEIRNSNTFNNLDTLIEIFSDINNIDYYDI